MKCQKKVIIGFGTLFLAFFSVLFASPSYAIDDFSLIWNSEGRPQFQDICGGSSGRLCSDYNYLLVKQQFPINFSNVYPDTYLTFYLNTSINILTPIGCLGDLTFYQLSGVNSLRYNSQFSVPDYLAQGVSVTVTLTDTSPFFVPSGSISLSSNGSYDVSQYSTAIVDVPAEIVYGDYHDDLVNIKIGIYVCAGTLLVLYFFYCIYRLIIRNSGVK